MSDKIIAIKVDVEGTSDQKKKLAGLEKGLKELTEERKMLNKEIGKSEKLTDSQARRRAKLNSEIKDGIIMGVQHKKFNIHGVQFHPESIKTKFGMKILKNFINN